MSKGIKRQRKLEDMLGSSSTKKKKESQADASLVENTTVVNKKSSKCARERAVRRWMVLFLETTSSVPKISKEDLELLRHFDLDMTFGPCTGVCASDEIDLSRVNSFSRHSASWSVWTSATAWSWATCPRVGLDSTLPEWSRSHWQVKSIPIDSTNLFTSAYLF